MYCFRAGFLIVEILISLALITIFVAICMRYQTQTLALQAQAINSMEIVDRIEGILDDCKAGNRSQNNSDCKFSIAHDVGPITIPVVHGGPPNFSLEAACRMKVLTVTALPTGQSGQQVCVLPTIFKEEG